MQVVGHIEQGYIIFVHISREWRENGRQVTGCVLYLSFTKDAPQGVEVVKVTKQKPTLAADRAVNDFSYSAFRMTLPQAKSGDRP